MDEYPGAFEDQWLSFGIIGEIGWFFTLSLTQSFVVF